MREYEVIKGTENEIEFQGLKGIYVWGTLGGIAGVVFLGIILFMILPQAHLVLLITLGGIGAILYFAFTFNSTYGRWGYQRKKIKEGLPSHVIVRRPKSLRR